MAKGTIRLTFSGHVFFFRASENVLDLQCVRDVLFLNLSSIARLKKKEYISRKSRTRARARNGHSDYSISGEFSKNQMENHQLFSNLYKIIYFISDFLYRDQNVSFEKYIFIFSLFTFYLKNMKGDISVFLSSLL